MSEDEPVTVLEPSHRVQPPRGAIATLAKRLEARGWAVTVTRSVASNPAVRYVTDSDGHQKGEVRYPPFIQETFVLIGEIHNGPAALVVEAVWVKKGDESLKFKEARTFDPVLGFEWRPKLRSSRKRSQIEIDEGIQPPIGLEQWLSIVAPKVGQVKEEDE